MKARLIGWAERRGREAARRRAERLAAFVREQVRGASVEVREAAVIVSGNGLVKRWLIDPELRFLSGDGR